MAHFAKLDAQNIVTGMAGVNNTVMTDESGTEIEQMGVDFLNELHGEFNWKQASYNTRAGVHPEGRPLRKNYCGKGYIYHPPPVDGFSAPQPFPSWTLNEETCQWTPPVPMPEMGGGVLHTWNEDEQQWDLVE